MGAMQNNEFVESENFINKSNAKSVTHQ